ncbi:MAG: DUF4129 domain-containing transglutaminase family protein, partial [Stackebrandtia sp.]
DNGFSYELATEDGDSSSAIENFLTKGKAGYCQQYAASMAWMVRDADIPARVAIGLTKGTASSQGYRLTNFNFHAWVEVYFSGYGWVPFDPTPSSGVRNSESSQWAPDPNAEQDDDSDDGANPDDNGGSADGGPNNEPKPGENGSEPGDSATVVAWDGRQPPTVWPYWMAAAIAVAGVAVTPSLVRTLRRRQRLSIPDSRPERAAQAAWDELVDTLADHRIAVNPAHTSRRIAEQVVDDMSLKDKPAAAGLRHLAAAIDHSRYAPRPPTGMSLRRAIEMIRSGLSQSASPLTQLRATLFPPSVLSSWRRRGSRMSAGVTDGVIGTRLGTKRLLLRLRPQRFRR